MPPALGAKRGDPDLSPDRSLAPGLGGRRGAPSARLPDIQPSEPVDDGKPPGHQAPTALPLRRSPRPTRGFRAPAPLAKRVPDRRPDQLRPRAASVARHLEDRPLAACTVRKRVGGARTRVGRAHRLLASWSRSTGIEAWRNDEAFESLNSLVVTRASSSVMLRRNERTGSVVRKAVARPGTRV